MLFIENKNEGHYALIKNLSRLMHSHLILQKHKKFFCSFCLCFYLTEENLNLHLPNCLKFNDAIPVIPKKKYIEFENIVKQQILPFCLYADSEAV